MIAMIPQTMVAAGPVTAGSLTEAGVTVAADGAAFGDLVAVPAPQASPTGTPAMAVPDTDGLTPVPPDAGWSLQPPAVLLGLVTPADPAAVPAQAETGEEERESVEGLMADPAWLALQPDAPAILAAVEGVARRPGPTPHPTPERAIAEQAMPVQAAPVAGGGVDLTGTRAQAVTPPPVPMPALATPAIDSPAADQTDPPWPPDGLRTAPVPEMIAPAPVAQVAGPDARAVVRTQATGSPPDQKVAQPGQGLATADPATAAGDAPRAAPGAVLVSTRRMAPLSGQTAVGAAPTAGPMPRVQGDGAEDGTGPIVPPGTATPDAPNPAPDAPIAKTEPLQQRGVAPMAMRADIRVVRPDRRTQPDEPPARPEGGIRLAPAAAPQSPAPTVRLATAGTQPARPISAPRQETGIAAPALGRAALAQSPRVVMPDLAAPGPVIRDAAETTPDEVPDQVAVAKVAWPSPEVTARRDPAPPVAGPTIFTPRADVSSRDGAIRLPGARHSPLSENGDQGLVGPRGPDRPRQAAAAPALPRAVPVLRQTSGERVLTVPVPAQPDKSTRPVSPPDRAMDRPLAAPPVHSPVPPPSGWAGSPPFWPQTRPPRPEEPDDRDRTAPAQPNPMVTAGADQPRPASSTSLPDQVPLPPPLAEARPTDMATAPPSPTERPPMAEPPAVALQPAPAVPTSDLVMRPAGTGPSDQSLAPILPTHAPAASQGPEPLPPKVAVSLTEAAKRANKDEPIELLLDPVELGKVRFELITAGDKVQVNLSVERPETLDLLRRNIDMLRSELNAAGFDASTLNFGQWKNGREDPALAPSPPIPFDDDLAPLDQPNLPPSARMARDQGLNLRL